MGSLRLCQQKRSYADDAVSARRLSGPGSCREQGAGRRAPGLGCLDSGGRAFFLEPAVLPQEPAGRPAAPAAAAAMYNAQLHRDKIEREEFEKRLKGPKASRAQMLRAAARKKRRDEAMTNAYHSRAESW
eukprot:SAG22_NODE_8017_length_691_cov_0.652027_2_plen_129_part_01